MSDKNRRQDAARPGWTEAILAAIADWLPDLPRAAKTVFAGAAIYLVLCLVAQISPVALFQAVGNATGDWVDQNRQIEAEARGAARQERADIIALLRDQNADLRTQLQTAYPGPVIASRVADHDRALRQLQYQMDVLMDQHPRARAAARGPPE